MSWPIAPIYVNPVRDEGMPMRVCAVGLTDCARALKSIVLAHVGHVEEAIAERGYNALQDDSV